MIYLLLFLLLILALDFYYLFGKDILSPSLIASIMFMISTFVAALNMRIWGVTIHSKTIIVILSTLMSFGLGEFLTRFIFYNKERYNAKIENIPNAIIIESKKLFVIFIFFLIGFLGYLSTTIQLAKLAGWKHGVGLIDYAHYVRLHPEIYGVPAFERFFNWWKNFCKIFVFVISFIFLRNYILNKVKKYFYLIFIVFYFLFNFLSGGRAELIDYFIFICFIAICFYMHTKSWNSKYYYKVIKTILKATFLFLVIFLIAGNLRSKNVFGRVWRVLSLYIGESIPLLDNYLMNPRAPDSLFGENTLFGIYRFLRKFSDSIPYLYAPYEFTTFINGESGNVYTMIRRYHEDFGYLGLFALSFFISSVYTFCLITVRKKNDWRLMIYAMCFSPIINISIEERLFIYIVDIGYIAILIISIGVFYFVIGKNKSNLKKIFLYKNKLQNLQK